MALDRHGEALGSVEASVRQPAAGVVDAVYSFTAAYFDALAISGVRHVVVSPGSRSTPLTLSAVRQPALKCWTVIDERSAGFLALGIARTAREPVALVCTSGSAAANYWPAVVEARHAHVPLILLTADRPPDLRGWGAGQTIDQLRLYGEYARWLGDMPIAGEGGATLAVARSWAARTVAEARRRPAGVVHLNWPFREPLEPVGSVASDPPGHTPLYIEEAPVPAPDAVARLSAWTLSHPRGLIACGPIDADADLADAIANLSRVVGWPIWADPLSGLRSGEHFGSTPILSAGDLWARDKEFAKSVTPRAVLRFGPMPTSKAFRSWIQQSGCLDIVQIDPESDWADPDRMSTSVIRCDATALCRAILRRLGSNGEGVEATRGDGWADQLVRVDQASSAAARDSLEADSWCEPAAVAAVADALPSDAVLWVASSMPVRDLDAWLPGGKRRIRVLSNRGVNGIDGTISSALGAAASSRLPTLLLCGDLAFLHDLSAMVSVTRLDLPLVIVVLDNDGGGIFSMLPVAGAIEHQEFESYFRTPHGLDLSRAASLFGVELSEVFDAGQMRRAVADGLASGRPRLVLARIDPDAGWKARVAAWSAAARAARAGATRCR